jgi:hypothetical protein
MSNPYQNCTDVSPACPVDQTIYGYYPNLGVNSFFTAWFFILTVAQVYLGYRYKTWTYLIGAAGGCVLEGAGYIGRVMMHSNPWNDSGFNLQITCLIIAPAFLSAAIYLTLKHITLYLGPQYSIIKPRWYTYIFIGCDILSLTLQGAGGGIAASADRGSNMLNVGSDLMIAGIVWQVVTLSAFAGMVGLYFWRVWREKPGALSATDLRFKLFLFGVFVAYITIFVRCVYRYVCSLYLQPVYHVPALDLSVIYSPAISLLPLVLLPLFTPSMLLLPSEALPPCYPSFHCLFLYR